MILFIDTSDLEHVRFALINEADKTIKEETYRLAFKDNYKTLEQLQKFLKKYKIKPTLAGITKMIACTGPGSFTGLRVGTSLLQGMHLSTQIPLYSIPKKKLPPDLGKLATMKLVSGISIEYDKKAVY